MDKIQVPLELGQVPWTEPNPTPEFKETIWSKMGKICIQLSTCIMSMYEMNEYVQLFEGNKIFDSSGLFYFFSCEFASNV